MNEQGLNVARRRLPRVGLISADAMRVSGLQSILDDGMAFEVVVCSTPKELATASVELVLIDSIGDDRLFDLLALLRRLRPRLRLLVIGPREDMAQVERVIGAGAKGYLHQSVSELELRTAIDEVRDGSMWAPRRVLVRLLESNLAEGGAPAGQVHFTRRELEVLRLLILGHPNRKIASTLGVDEGTVKAHMGRLMRKAGVDNRTALSMKALERRWSL